VPRRWGYAQASRWRERTRILKGENPADLPVAGTAMRREHLELADRQVEEDERTVVETASVPHAKNWGAQRTVRGSGY